MKILKCCAIVIPLFAASFAYAGSKSFDYKYTPEVFNNTPAFYCETTASPSILNPVTVTITADPELQMTGGSTITDKATTINFLHTYYFQAAHKPDGDAHVTITVSGDTVDEHKTSLKCMSGNHGRKLYQ